MLRRAALPRGTGGNGGGHWGSGSADTRTGTPRVRALLRGPCRPGSRRGHNAADFTAISPVALTAVLHCRARPRRRVDALYLHDYHPSRLKLTEEMNGGF